MLIEFPAFRPDMHDLNNPGLITLTNAIPVNDSYKNVLGLTSYSDALTAYCRGAFAARRSSTGASANFAGDATKLYYLGKTTKSIFEDVSKSGGYALGLSDMWAFTQFGNDVIAVSITETPQTFTVGTSTDFADLTGTPPKARYITSFKDFVMVGNTYDAVDGNVPHRVRWAGIGTTTSWGVSSTTQADAQDLDPQWGWVQGIVGGDFGTVFQERAISRFNYIGSPAIFQFELAETNRGTRFPGSIIKVGNLIYYISHDGFYVFDGDRSTSIGDEQVDDFFYTDIDLNYEYRVCASVDYKNSIIAWAYPGVGNSSGRPNKILYYNFSPNATKKWGYAEVQVEFLYVGYSEGYTLDTLDDYLSAQGLAISIELLPYSLDSRFWTGNDIIVGAFNSDHKLSLFSGTALTAVIETAEVQLTEGQRSDLLRVKPIVDGTDASVSVQIGTRNLQKSAVSFSSAVTLDTNGDAQVRKNAFFHRMRVTIAGGFNQAIGFEVLDYKAGGDR